ncbi:MAG: S8 family serine peptidase [Firmicutes bacterium]|nr:S8 family serine peptidase [Bacillota bacterium]
MRKKVIITTAITACACLLIGLACFWGGPEKQERDRALDAKAGQPLHIASAEGHPEELSGGGEPIEGEFIVRKADGSYDLVKTDDPEKLKKDPQIEGVEQNRTVVAFDTETMAITGTDVTDMQYGDKLVRAPEGWKMLEGEETKTVRIAVVDTGVDADHPDLAGKVLPGKTIVQETAAGNRYEDGGYDDNGHGTHVAGIIAATIDNGQGINGITGPVDAEILPVKVLNDAGQGSTFDIIEGLQYAADQGASIINLSLGFYSRSDMEAEAVEYAQNKGCLIIAAAGNDAFNVQYTYPASYDGVLSVGSVDSGGERSYFSNFGESLDVAAPGSDIVSCIPETIARQKIAQGGVVYGNGEEGYYASMSGTSMATPHASGAAALYKAAHPEEIGFDIADLMISTCQDVGDPGKDIETGAGIVDAAAMLGGEIIRTPLTVKKPVEGQEVYEQISLSAQINPAMGISRLCFYLDEQTEDHRIAEIPCDAGHAFCSAVWDTKSSPDGDHRLLAAVYDENGEQIGQTQEVNVRVLNSIADGFTLQVNDPAGTEANTASYYIYEKDAGGQYSLVKRGKTSDLGYARIKGLSEETSEYDLYICGAANREDGGKTRYVYRRTLSVDQLGTKVIIDGTQSQKIDFAATGEDDEPLASPYLKVCPACGEDWMSEESPFRAQEDTELYLDDGAYRIALLHEVDRNGTAFCIEKEFTIGDTGRQIRFAPSDGVRLQGKYPEDAAGEMVIEGADAASEIPFLSGSMYGSRFYLTKGKTYTVQATLKAEDSSGNIWSVQLQKAEPVQVEADQNITFAPQIGVSELTCSQEEIFIGEHLTTAAVFGDASSDRIISMMSHFPVLRIYREENGERTLVFEKESRWNMDAPSWDSARDYSGTVPPAAGSYIAQLSFDAGPFGGETSKEIPFLLKTRSGKEEMSSTIRIRDGEKEYKAAGAFLSIYTWDGQQQIWTAATPQKIPAADTETGVIRGIRTEDITLNESGIHAAVVTLKQRKDGYQSPESYYGFAVVPFTELSDLSEITIDAGTLEQVSVKAADRAGNLQAANIAIPISAGGGSLTEPQMIGEYSCRLTRDGTGTKLHLPAGSYKYLYGTFSDSRDSYVLFHEGFTAGAEEGILLSGEDTVKLTLSLPEHFSLRMDLCPEGMEKGPAFSPATDSVRISRGSYEASAVLTDPAEQYRYTVSVAQKLDISEDAAWTIDGNWKGELSLDRRVVKPGEDLTGKILIQDGQGNLLTKLEKQDEDSGNFAEIRPLLSLQAEGGESQPLETDADGFRVDGGLLSSEGTYLLQMTSEIPGGGSLNGQTSFRVQAEHEVPLWKTAAKLTYEWTGTGELTLRWKTSDVKTYDDCSVIGYRIYYSENELKKWKDLTGEDLIREESARVGMAPKTSGYYKVEAVDETGAVSRTGPDVEVLGQYPWLTIRSEDSGSEIEVYETDLMQIPWSQARYSARNNYGTDKWYAAQGIYFDDLLETMGYRGYDWISVRGDGMDPFSFQTEDIAGTGYYYYPKDYDDDQVKAELVKPMLVLTYTESETQEPAFGEGGEGLPRLFFGQQHVGDVNRPFFVKEVYEIVVHGSSVAPEDQDIDPVTPSDAAAEKAAVDQALLPKIRASGITAAVNAKGKSVTLKITPVKNAVNYRISWRQAGTQNWTAEWTGGKTTGTVRALKAKGLYEFKITAFAKKDGVWYRSEDSSVSRAYLAGLSQIRAKAGKKQLKASWKPVKGATGHRILYSTKKNMKGAKVKKVKGASKKKIRIKKLRKKKYYVRIQPYKVYQGKTYYGSLSARKAVKVK